MTCVDILLKIWLQRINSYSEHEMHPINKINSSLKPHDCHWGWNENQHTNNGPRTDIWLKPSYRQIKPDTAGLQLIKACRLIERYRLVSRVTSSIWLKLTKTWPDLECLTCTERLGFTLRALNATIITQWCKKPKSDLLKTYHVATSRALLNKLTHDWFSTALDKFKIYKCNCFSALRVELMKP